MKNKETNLDKNVKSATTGREIEAKKTSKDTLEYPETRVAKEEPYKVDCNKKMP